MTVLINVQFNHNGSDVKADFSLESSSPGVTVSGNLLRFRHGSYDVVVSLPDGFTGDGILEWIEEPPSSIVSSLTSGETFVEFHLDNSVSSLTEFEFQLGAETVPEEREEPTVRSEPPPTLVLESS